MTASVGQDLVGRRRAAEKQLHEVGGRLARRLGRPWTVPKRQWDMEAWRCALLEAVVDLVEAATADAPARADDDKRMS